MAKKKHINTAMINAKIDLINTHYGLDFRFEYEDMKTRTTGGNHSNYLLYRVTAKNQSYEITKGSKTDINNHLNAIIRTLELMKFNGRFK